MHKKTKSAMALGLIDRGLSLKQVAKQMGVRHQWLVAVVASPLPRFKFGVELETMYSDEIQGLSSEFNVFYGVGYHGRPEGYDMHNMYHWMQTYDGSLDLYGEYVSPILQGEKGFSILKQMCKALIQSGATVNKRCGLHVHVDREHFSGREHVHRFTDLYKHMEKEMDTIVSPSRRESRNSYCRSLESYDPRSGRYGKVNLTRDSTVEVRHHQGTLNYNKIFNWIKIIHYLVEASRPSLKVRKGAKLIDICRDSTTKQYVSRRQKELLPS